VSIAAAFAAAALPRAGRAAFRIAFAAALLGPCLASSAMAGADDPSPQRRQQLVHMVRQDCGACHGLRLTGGLGPALTPTALRDWTPDGITATILNGRPGTPMPPWKSFVSEAEAQWIARNLLAGFPREPGAPQ